LKILVAYMLLASILGLATVYALNLVLEGYGNAELKPVEYTPSRASDLEERKSLTIGGVRVVGFEFYSLVIALISASITFYIIKRRSTRIYGSLKASRISSNLYAPYG